MSGIPVAIDSEVKLTTHLMIPLSTFPASPGTLSTASFLDPVNVFCRSVELPFEFLDTVCGRAEHSGYLWNGIQEVSLEKLYAQVLG